MSNDKYPKLSEYFVQNFDMYNPMFLSEETLETITDIVLEEAGFKWIPVSERLPEESNYYTVTMKGNIIEYYIDVVYFNAKHNAWVYQEYPDTVIAWMVLKPYDPQP